MTDATVWLAVAGAGGTGAVARFLVDLGVSRWLASRFPFGTLAVNVSGSFVAGMVAGLALAGHLGVEVGVIVAGGFLGAYTTFSTAMFQVLSELAERRIGAATVDLVGTLVLSVGAASSGVAIIT